MTDITLQVDVRSRTGTGGARASRREGFVPGVLYGGPLGPVAIQLRDNELRKALSLGGFKSKLVTISHKGVAQPVLVRDIQFHPVTSVATHIDLMRVEGDQELRVQVPVHFTNEEKCPGLKRGGALNVVRHLVELICKADRIPAEILIDLEGRDIGESIHISAVALPPGVKPAIQDRDFTIATIVSPGGAVEAAEAPAAT